MSIKLATFRGVTIAAPTDQLGDGLDATKISISEPGGAGGSIFDGELYADSLTQEPNAGSIDYVVFGIRSRASGCTMTDQQIEWKLGSTVAQESVAVSGSTVMEARSSNVATDPNGMGWTWANLSALVNVGIAFSITIPPHGTGEVDLTEVYVEAWGEPASSGVRVDAVAGSVAADGSATAVAPAAVAGSIEADGSVA